MKTTPPVSIQTSGVNLVPDMMARKRVNGAAKGAKFERDLADYFTLLGYPARRMIRTGTVKHADEGDIDGLPFTVQAKDWTKSRPKGMTDAQLIDVVLDARKQAHARGHSIGVAVEKVARQPVTHAWAHLDLLTLRMVTPGEFLPASPGVAELLRQTHARLRLGALMRLLVVTYPPESVER